MAVTQDAEIPARLAHWERPAAASRRVAQLRGALRLLLLYASAGVIAAICLVPILWMVKTSFETPEFIRSAQVQFWPIAPTLQNYRDVLENPNAMIGRSMLNSVLVALLATLLNLTVTIAAGYCLSRFEFRGKLVFAMYLLLFYMIPRTLLLIGLFVMLARLQLLNSLFGLILVYAAVGVPLATWWLMVGLAMPGLHRMFLWEGATLIVVLLAGGIAMIVAIHREDRRRQALEMFFMSFTHDLKTSLASVQLQAEGIREDSPHTTARLPLDRLLHDVVRLQIQLENSLFVAQPDGRLLQERLDAGAAITRLAEDWPGLVVEVHGEACVSADARAFDVVLRNVLQNAVLHGTATRVDVDVRKQPGNMVRLAVRDNGRGMSPESAVLLGQPFARPAPTSGSGVGLFVSSRLVARMGGAMTFLQPNDGAGGLALSIDLPESR